MRRYFSRFDLGKYLALLAGPEGINKYMPPAFAPFSHELLKFNPLRSNLPAADSVLAAPTHDILNREAKMWRGSLCMIVSEGLGGTAESVLPMAVSLEILHCASLVIDDIQDKSKFRRGQPSLQELHGDATAINIGNYMLFLPFVLINRAAFSDIARLNMLDAAAQEMAKMTIGQGLDIQWATEKALPTLENYLFMINCKTSVIVRLAVKLAAYANAAPESVLNDLVEFSDNIGCAFQIKDDLLNLESTEYAKGRSYLGEDITEGKRTAILIRAVDQSPHKQRLLDILQMKTSDPGLVSEALEIIRSTDALEWAQSLANDLVDRGLQSLKKCSLKQESEVFLEHLARFIVTRTK